MLGFGEILVIVVVLLVIFGASRLPAIGRSLGAGLREMKKGFKEGLADEPSKPEDNEKKS